MAGDIAVQINELRPTFFRFLSGRAFSGWQSPSGDFWATWEVLEEAVEFLKGEGCKALACELLLSKPDELLPIYLMKHADGALEDGEVLVFTDDVDLHPLDYVEAGERCVSLRDCRTLGTVKLFMSNVHMRLADDNNCLIIEPHTCDEFLGKIKLVPRAHKHPYREVLTAAA